MPSDARVRTWDDRHLAQDARHPASDPCAPAWDARATPSDARHPVWDRRQIARDAPHRPSEPRHPAPDPCPHAPHDLSPVSHADLNGNIRRTTFRASHSSPDAMNDRQRARLNSYRATLAAFDRYPAEVAAIPALDRSVTWVRDHVAELNAAVQAQATYAPQGEAKAADRKALAAAAVPVAQALSAQADEDGDEASADLYDFTDSDFLYDTEQDALDRAGIVRDAARAADPTALADYGITPAHLTALDDAYTAFRDALSTPRDAVAVRSAHTVAIERLVPLIGAHLRKRTDRVMAAYRGTPFGDEYATARTIVDP